MHFIKDRIVRKLQVKIQVHLLRENSAVYKSYFVTDADKESIFPFTVSFSSYAKKERVFIRTCLSMRSFVRFWRRATINDSLILPICLGICGSFEYKKSWPAIFIHRLGLHSYQSFSSLKVLILILVKITTIVWSSAEICVPECKFDQKFYAIWLENHARF